MWRSYSDAGHRTAIDDRPVMAAEDDLRAWLESATSDLVDKTIPKSVEYGSTDLEIIGHMMARLMPGAPRDERTALQLGTAFYCVGKIARILSALGDGRQPSADSWFDVAVYGLMGLRENEEGKWL
jgi:hypothetical protein